MIGHDPTRTYKAAVIGAGSGGLTLAIGLAGFGHDTVLVEGGKIGGDCTNVGCVPSKALLHAAAVGYERPFDDVRRKRDDLEERESVEMEEHDQIHLVRGWARLTGRRSANAHVVDVEGPDGNVQVLAEHVVLAGGSQPIDIPIEGLPVHRHLTNENLFDLTEVPSSMLLVGGGAISLEMATAFGDLGTRIDIVELQDRLMGNDDPMVSETIRDALVARGIRVHTDTSIDRFDDATRSAHLSNGTVIDAVDKVLIGVGRRPRLDGLGLDVAGVETGRHGVVADDWGRTSVDGIWAVGDITGNTLTTHGANAIGRRVVRAIALPKLPKTGGVRSMPTAVYSRPQIASIGLTMNELNERSEAGRRRYTVALKDIDRGYTDDVEYGFVTVDVERFSGKVLRASIVGPAAAELIGMFTLMIDYGIGLRKVFGMIHPYPAYAQAIGQLADDFARDTYPRLPAEWLAMMRGKVANRF